MASKFKYFDLFFPGFRIEQALLAPGFLTEFEKNFQFHTKHLKASDKTLAKISRKIKNSLDPIWVGIHVRRQDYQIYEESLNLIPLKPSYYLKAMDTFRQFYPENTLIFVVITDDISWCKQHVKKRAKDVFIVSQPKAELYDGIGHDLAVMSKCNHTIISRGSFSYFSSILAGGATILPCHFEEYKLKDKEDDNDDTCNRHPLHTPLDKLYPIQN